MTRSTRNRTAWLAVEWLLLAAWVAAAALDMAHRRAGFLTNHAADLTLPAWLYVSFRSRSAASRLVWRRTLATAHPLVLAAVVFAASAATEVSQHFWPHGLFSGTFDPLDIVAYGVGLGLTSLSDMRWPIPLRSGSPGPGHWHSA